MRTDVDTIVSILTINNIQPSDSGTIYCAARSSADGGSRRIMVSATFSVLGMWLIRKIDYCQLQT